MEGASHTTTRNFASKGRKTAAEEMGQPLSYSEALDLRDPPVLELGRDVAEKILQLNRQNHPGKF